jgi:hypothetical protein
MTIQIVIRSIAYKQAKEFDMESMFPSWTLPLWIIGAPVVLVIVNHLTSRNHSSEALRSPTAATPYGAGARLATR